MTPQDKLRLISHLRFCVKRTAEPGHWGRNRLSGFYSELDKNPYI